MSIGLLDFFSSDGKFFGALSLSLSLSHLLTHTHCPSVSLSNSLTLSLPFVLRISSINGEEAETNVSKLQFWGEIDDLLFVACPGTLVQLLKRSQSSFGRSICGKASSPCIFEQSSQALKKLFMMGNLNCSFNQWKQLYDDWKQQAKASSLTDRYWNTWSVCGLKPKFLLIFCCNRKWTCYCLSSILLFCPERERERNCLFVRMREGEANQPVAVTTKCIKWCSKWIKINFGKGGSGCGSVGRVVAFDTRGPQFDSSHQQIIYWTFVC